MITHRQQKITRSMYLPTLIALTLILAQTSIAFAKDGPANVFITLGTNGGPEAEVDRAQPANALLVGDELYLVDAGDGAAAQLVEAGFRLTELKGVFLSHLHFDHTGGVLAVLGLRMQLSARNTLTIYGPPGTRTFIDGLVSGMQPAMQAAYGMPGQEWQANVEVKELVDESIVKLDGLTVTAAENSHFAIPEVSGAKEKAKSLSFRFDMPDRSIVYTGDTGPSINVEELAKGADLLIAEMMDIPAVMARIRRMSPNATDEGLARVEWHFRAHHIMPEQVGELATAAGVPTVVMTHIAPSIKSDEQAQKILAAVATTFDGQIQIASDFDRF